MNDLALPIATDVTVYATDPHLLARAVRRTIEEVGKLKAENEKLKRANEHLRWAMRPSHD